MRSIGSLFKRYYDPFSIWENVLVWRVSASKTLARPLSDGKILMVPFTALLPVSACSGSSGLIADSTLTTISVAGILSGVTTKFRPFFRYGSLGIAG